MDWRRATGPNQNEATNNDYEQSKIYFDEHS